MNHSERIVIIGGGIAGLAAAALLAREGASVTLLEAHNEVGGRAGSWEKAGFRFDTGPSWYLMPEVFDHFFKLFGSSAEQELDLELLDPGYRVYFEKQAEAVDIAVDRAGNVALFESMQPGAGKSLERYLDSAEEAYNLALAEFLYTNFEKKSALLRSPVVKRMPKLFDLMATSLDKYVGRYFKDSRLKQILGFPAVFLATSPFHAPALFHLMSHLDLTQGVLYPQGGFTVLIERIRMTAEANGVTILTGARVEEILLDQANGGSGKAVMAARGVRVERDGKSETIEADVVVSAADLHHTETQLLPEDAQSYPESWWQKRDAGPGAVLAYLGIKGEVPNLLHHNLFFTEDWTGDFEQLFPAKPGASRSIPNPASFYACVPSVTDSSVAPKGDTNMFLLIPVPSDTGIGAGGENGSGSAAVEAAVEVAIDQIIARTGDATFRDRIVVRRTVGPADFERELNSWNGGALGPAHTLKQSAFFRASIRSKKVDGLFYVGGSSIPGIGLPMCLISAEVLVKTLRGSTDASPLPEPVTAAP